MPMQTYISVCRSCAGYRFENNTLVRIWWWLQRPPADVSAIEPIGPIHVFDHRIGAIAGLLQRVAAGGDIQNAAPRGDDLPVFFGCACVEAHVETVIGKTVQSFDDGPLFIGVWLSV